MSGISLNEDPNNFLIDNGVAECEDGAPENVIDFYTRSGTVKEILFSPNAMRTCYAGKVFEPFWQDVEFRPDGRLFFRGREISGPSNIRYLNNAKALHEAGIDLLGRWITATRKKGCAPWLSVRVNDLHDVDKEDFFSHSEFWRSNLEFRRVTHREMQDWPDKALDFTHEPVRQRLLTLTEELFERYDVDGLEIDWMRFGYHFKPGFEDEGRRVTTDMHRRLRQLADEAAKRRGHAVKISARVPAHPEDAFGLGFDPFEWVSEKLVDMIVPTPFWATMDTATPVKLWRKLLGPNIILAIGLELLTRPYPAAKPMISTASMAMANACNYLHQGADRIYLFNYMKGQTSVATEAELCEILENAGDLSKAAVAKRRHVLTYTDTTPPGIPLPTCLPLELAPKQIGQLRLSIGTAPQSNQRTTILLGFEKPTEDITVWLNGSELPMEKVPDEPVPEAVRHRLSFDALDRVKEADNIIEVRNNCSGTLSLLWCELIISRPI